MSDVKIITEADFLGGNNDVPEDCDLVSLKLISFGANTLEVVRKNPEKISEIYAKQPTFFLISKKGELRKTLHDLIDKFCDLKETS